MPETSPPAVPAALSAAEPPLPADLAAAFDAASGETGVSVPAEPAPVMVVMPPAEDVAAPDEGAASTVVSVVSSDGEGGASAVMVAAGEGAAAAAGADAAGGSAAAAGAAGRGGAAVAVAGGLQLSEHVGPVSTVYKRAPQLKADKALVKLLVPEKRLTELWDEIALLEAQAAQLQRGSQLLVTEMIDRLASARNQLLHSRDQYENALREVVYVRYRLTRIKHSALLEQPQAILAYLVIVLVALIAAFLTTPRLIAGLGSPAAIAGVEALTLFNTAFWGALGGLAAAFFALQRHVEDFDQQHARWYYLSPLVGLFIGPLMGLVAGLGFPALFQLVSDQPANVEVRPALLYLLAWTVGYQQNLLLELIRSVLKRVFPQPAEESPKTDPPIR